MTPYQSRFGPIPLDHFGNDADPSIEVDRGPGSVYARVMARIGENGSGRQHSKYRLSRSCSSCGFDKCQIGLQRDNLAVFLKIWSAYSSRHLPLPPASAA